MRDIRFRVWSPSAREMCYDARVGGFADTVPTVFHGGEWVHVDPYVEMQYTGLRDRNGVEIWEGDILSETVPAGFIWAGEDGDEVKVPFKERKWQKEVRWEYEWARFNVQPFLKKSYGFHEVIGNVYQNPQLLTKPE